MRTTEHINNDLSLIEKFINATNEQLKDSPGKLDYIFKLQGYLNCKKKLVLEYNKLTGLSPILQ